MRTSVLQEWLTQIPLRMQSTLILGLRGPDTSVCPHVKKICRWMRGLAFKPGNPANVAEFMSDKPGPILDRSAIARELEFCTMHFYGHLSHALEVIAYRHPDQEVAIHAFGLYQNLCTLSHLPAETKSDFEQRLKYLIWPGGVQPDTFEEAMDMTRGGWAT